MSKEHNQLIINFPCESSNKVLSIVWDKVNVRRNRVLKLLIKKYTQKQIAEKMGYSISTIEKDLHFLRKISHLVYSGDQENDVE